MITSIFSKSKPINYVIVSCFILIIYTVFHFSTISEDLGNVFPFILYLLILISYIFILDFIILKNGLSLKNSYIILTFAILLSFFPQVVNHQNLIYSNLFILLAYRRLLSLRSSSNTTIKLFDIGLWVAFAALFYFWSILFLALVVIALIHYNRLTIKTLVIPFLGVATAFLLLVSYNLIIANEYLLSTNFNTQINVNYTNYNNTRSIIKLTVLLSVLIWVSIHYFNILKHKNKNLRPSYFLTFCAICIAITIALLAPNKTGGEFLFLYAPLSIFTGNYIESVKERWFKDLFIILILISATLVEVLF